ncbi:MAG: substrate-binding domain-containing protein [Planctomycetota bacterium]|jgi:D-xylose transport system substrate-binding protein|nr:substrate-binding domain-containing protein [Planctomycetota bacterium]
MLKSRLSLTVLAVFAVCSSFVLAGQRPVVGLALPTQQEERWTRDLSAMREEAEKLGVDLRVQIARNDQNQQNNQVDQLLSQGIKVLIIAAHDCEGAGVAVKKARDEGVKVISYDRVITGCEYELFTGFDSVKVGEIQGTWLHKHMPKGRYIMMSGAPTDFNATLFRRGADNILVPYIEKGDIEVIMDQPVIDWQPANAQKIVENALTLANNNVDAVLAPNDGTAGGAISALEAQGLAGKVFVAGHDGDLAAAQRIVRGTQSMTVLKDTRILARETIAMAKKLALGEPVDTKGQTQYNEYMDIPAALLEPLGVDKDNLDAILIDSGYLKREDVYKD